MVLKVEKRAGSAKISMNARKLGGIIAQRTLNVRIYLGHLIAPAGLGTKVIRTRTAQIKTSVTTVRRCVPKAVLTLLGHIDAHAKMDFNFLVTRPPVKI